jgi:2,3-bisphosphoglycerate-dependent phosphoglycerate mutase
MRLYLVRHAQTAWNLENRAQGHMDIPLDPTGEAQARSLGQAFKDVPVGRILSSDLTRCRQTAAPIAEATGTSVTLRPDLRERAFGEWEGHGFDDVGRRMLDVALEQGVSRQLVRPPGGESFADVWERLERVAEELFDTAEPTVVVTHGGAAALLLARLIRGSLDTSRAFRFANTSVTELQLRPEGLFHMIRYNDIAHLLDGSALSGSLEGVSR